ncbi:MAG: hypothetical protein HUU34_01120 [Saprospiraceae bacterium]|nr:hypothetical protein [Saprospiraceae bacterium]
MAASIETCPFLKNTDNRGFKPTHPSMFHRRGYTGALTKAGITLPESASMVFLYSNTGA